MKRFLLTAFVFPVICMGFVGKDAVPSKLSEIPSRLDGRDFRCLEKNDVSHIYDQAVVRRSELFDGITYGRDLERVRAIHRAVPNDSAAELDIRFYARGDRPNTLFDFIVVQRGEQILELLSDRRRENWTTKPIGTFSKGVLRIEKGEGREKEVIQLDFNFPDIYLVAQKDGFYCYAKVSR